MNTLQELVTRLIRFLTYGIWHVHFSDISRAKAFGFRQIRTLLIAGQGFVKDRCGLRASALTFYAALSAVPILALVLAIARGFGLDTMLEREVINRLPNYEAVLSQIFIFAYRLIENTKGNLFAGVGVLVLLWTVPRMMASIEKSFNDVWHVREGRSVFRRLTDYLGLLLFGSLCLILAGGLTVFSTTKLPDILSQYGLWRISSPLVTAFLKFLPYLLMWFIFTILYLVAPNTHVNVRAAIIGGIVAGTACQAIQWLYLRAQIGVSRYDAVYGGVAALPLFITWMQTSWMIVLFGAELSYGVQNAIGFYPDEIKRAISVRHRRLLTLLVAGTILKSIARNQKPPSEHVIANRTGIPLGLVRELLDNLVSAGIVVVASEGKRGDRVFYPARDINELTIGRVSHDLEGIGDTVVPVVQSDEWRAILATSEDFERIVGQSPANKLLKDI